MNLTIKCGDALGKLRELPDESVHCCVTSPPYWGLRDYSCEGQLGLEKTPEEYVGKMVEVFREVRRVLRKDGTLWLNLGDSYAGGGNNRGNNSPISEKQGSNGGATGQVGVRDVPSGLKPKDLCGIPWRVAFALQTDGWVLRSEIIWKKPNPMPESVTDRPTKAHEQIFLFAKANWSGPPKGRFGGITDEDARWLSLCIDTEGCIVVKRVKQNDGGADAFGPQVTFGGTNRELVERFRAIVGHGNIAERPGKNAPMFYWQISNNIARDFLYRIYPFLIVKQRQARIAIYVDDLVYYRGGKFLSRKQRTKEENDQLLALWARNKQCNQFENPDLLDVPEPKYGRWSDCARYFYDAEAIKEGSITDDPRRPYGSPGANILDPRNRQGNGELRESPSGRNKRSVWTVATAPYPEAHFATYPPDLIKPCILAGTSAKGCCAKCGAPWERIVKNTPMVIDRSDRTHELGRTRSSGTMVEPATAKTIGWRPTCECRFNPMEMHYGDKYFEVKPCTVLDPFAGSGTTGAVALELGRKAILIELNPKYVELIETRCNVTPGLALA